MPQRAAGGRRAPAPRLGLGLEPLQRIGRRAEGERDGLRRKGSHNHRGHRKELEMRGAVRAWRRAGGRRTSPSDAPPSAATMAPRPHTGLPFTAMISRPIGTALCFAGDADAGSEKADTCPPSEITMPKPWAAVLRTPTVISAMVAAFAAGERPPRRSAASD